jgi:hypothetical protein
VAKPPLLAIANSGGFATALLNLRASVRMVGWVIPQTHYGSSISRLGVSRERSGVDRAGPNDRPSARSFAFYLTETRCPACATSVRATVH